ATEADVLMTFKTFTKYDIYFLREWLYAYRSHSAQGFDRKKQQRNLQEELKRLDNQFSILERFYRDNKKNLKAGRYFIQVPLFMTLAPINLYIIKFQLAKIIGYYRTAFKHFPDLFRHPLDWVVFLRIQIFFIG